jgi:hypothetical protein
MRKGFLLKKLLSFVVLAALFLNSCKNPDDFGLDIQPAADLLHTTYLDSFNIQAVTLADDSVSTSDVLYNLAGSQIDPVFGATHAGFYTHVLMAESNIDFGANPVLDSIFLCLDYAGLYYALNSSSTIPLRVYEVLEDFSADSVYYSYTDLQKSATPLVEYNLTPNLDDSVVVNGQTLAPHLRIPLPASWGQKFLDASGTLSLSNNENFLDFFKGFYVDARPLFMGKPGGSILKFNLISSLSNLSLYYHNDTDTANYSFVIDNNAARFNVFDHNAYLESYTQLQNQLQENYASADEYLFLQSMAGTKIKIVLPYLDQLTKIAVNKAELIFPIDQATSNTDNYVPPQSLSLVKVDNEGKYLFIQDQIASPSSFGGSYNASKNEYRFIISRYIQDLITGKEENNTLYLLVSGSAINANRIVLNGINKNPALKLAITYTRID